MELRYSVRFKNDIINHGGICHFEREVDLNDDYNKEIICEFIRRELLKRMKVWEKSGIDMISVEYFTLNSENEEEIFFSWSR